MSDGARVESEVLKLKPARSHIRVKTARNHGRKKVSLKQEEMIDKIIARAYIKETS